MTEKLAMRIGGENRPAWLQQRHWEKFGDSAGIKPRLVLKTLQDMSAAIIPSAQALANDFTKSYGTSPLIEKMLTSIRKRAGAACGEIMPTV